MDRSTIIAGLREEIDALNRAIEILEGGSSHTPVAKPAGKRGPKPGGKRRISAEGRARIAAATKARWARVRAEKAKAAKK